MRKKKRNGGGDTIKHVNHFTLVVTCPFFWWYNICVRPLNVVQLLGWRRPIGCLQLQVIFGKRATNYTALLQKTTSAHKASYGSSPLCSSHTLSLARARALSLVHSLSHIHMCVVSKHGTDFAKRKKIYPRAKKRNAHMIF